MTKRQRFVYHSVVAQLEEITRNKANTPRYRVIKSPSGTEFVLDTDELFVHRRPVQWPDEFYVGGTTRDKVYEAIDEERQYQDDKFGHTKEQSLPGYLVLLQNELNEANLGWAKDSKGRNSVLHEIRQMAALCVAAMEKYGTTGNAITTDDVPVEPS